jgi:hypothetical protein
LALLRRAVEGERPVDWCGRGEAEADLGLALLMNGEEPSGLQWLHSAQQRFQASGDIESLLKSIDNEASYLEHQGKKQAVLELRQRLASLG